MPASVNRVFAALVATAMLLVASPTEAEVGFRTLQIADPDGSQIDVALWYPAEAPAKSMQLGLGTQAVAIGAPLAGDRRPLIVISHGNGGSLAGHADTAQALAEAGFIVAALTHTGDNFRDQSRATDMPNRPRQLGVLLDHLLERWDDRHRLDPNRIGAFGFSAGGFTVLTAAGARPDVAAILEHCRLRPAFPDCRMAAQQPVDPETWTLWRRDDRIRALVVAAPALGFSLAASLARVTIPVQLWQAELDEPLPAPFYVEPVIAGLPTPPDYRLVRNAGHFDFLVPCTPHSAKEAPQFCTSRPGFDRVAFHADFNAAIVAFFRKTLGSDALPKSVTPQ